MAMDKAIRMLSEKLDRIEDKLEQLLAMFEPTGVDVDGFLPSDYDLLTADEIVNMARNWSSAVRDAVLEHEQANKARKSVIAALGSDGQNL